MASVVKHRRILGEALRKLRKEAGLTQEKLAEKAELSSVFISEVERGEKTVSVDSLMRIVQALDHRMCDVFKDL